MKMMDDLEEENNISGEEAPPILKSWPRFYILVAVNLIVLLVLFYTFTEVFK
jgi:hypothetical protein